MKKHHLQLLIVLFYIIIFFIVRDFKLVNDELDLYRAFSDQGILEIFSISWKNIFHFTESEYLSDITYFRPLLNLFYYIGFKIYDLLSIHPSFINISATLLLFNLVLKVFSLINQTWDTFIEPRFAALIYIFLPFNFESIIYFPNISDLLIQIFFFITYLTFYHNVRYRLFIILVGSLISLLVKETAIIFIFLTLFDAFINKRKIRKPDIYGILVFLLSFSIYIIIRYNFLESNSDIPTTYEMIINIVKSIVNFISFSQDINLLVITSIPLLLFLIQIVNNKKIIKLIYGILFSIPLGILLPDDRFFFLSYFLLLLLILDKKDILIIFMLISFIAFTYKTYSYYKAGEIRNQLNNKLLELRNNEICDIIILPYKLDNEAEIYYNGLSKYIHKYDIPILFKNKNRFRKTKISVTDENQMTIIKSNVSLRIPHLKYNIYTNNKVSVTLINDNEIQIFGRGDKNNYIVKDFSIYNR